ncbi:hypothetical protein PRK78_004474 [Emydomyces testavorans]|uniref:DUF7924 domain-containing protein n=1 Tax=Emydomyces testavorans TaxID=2070801 RepID=A0AAF0IJT2_9EURO|nr:hypothetical protein PRK78_004474 [Emydomyces testavorans]
MPSRSSAALRTDHDSVVDGSYMLETQLSNPCKRQRTEQHLPSPPPFKRQKKLPHHAPGYIDTPAFWDSLSKIWLTKHALREFNRRNSLLHAPCHQARSLTTQKFLVEQRNVRQCIAAADLLRNSAPKCLKDVKRFARHGGPNLSDLVGVCAACFLMYSAEADNATQYPEPTHLDRKMSSRRSSSYWNCGSSNSRTRTSERTTTGKSTSRTSKSSKTSNPNDANYQQKLIDGGVFPHGYKYPDGNRPPLPSNWDETNRRLAQPHPSLSPSPFLEKLYQKFVDADAEAFNEDAIKDKVLPAMLEAMGASRCTEKNILFTNLEPITSEIAQAKPDYYYGARPEQIHPHVRNKLIKRIIPSNHTHLPAVPNFFLEAKGPDGSAAVARRQACHDGAIGARAIQSLRSFGQREPVYDGNTYTISTIYHEGQLKMYGHSVAQPKGPGTRPEYYMHQLRSFAMTDTADSFRQGAVAFKNAMDLTEEYRNDAITQANERAGQTIEDAGDDEDEEEAESSNTILNVDSGTNQILSTLVEDEDESETSAKEDSRRVPPAKRSLSKPRQSHQRKRKTGISSSEGAVRDTGWSNRWSWFRW